MLKAIKTSKDKIYTGRMAGDFAHILREMPEEDRLDTLYFGYVQGEVFTLIGIAGIEQLQIILKGNIK